MGRALELAERGWGIVSPNPMVGAVVVSADGAIVGEGWHEGPGTAHAEVIALSQAGDAARGATLYSTLEPCNHHGRTPPCTDAIVTAGVANVVSGHGDPNPIVSGSGHATLRSAGVRVVDGVLAERVARKNRAYLTHVTTGRPFVVWKVAMSLDGKVAARDSSSRWITGEAARADVHRMRAWADAVVVGAGTVLADDPSLTVRHEGYRGGPPLRVIVDGRGRVPSTARVFDPDAPTLVATSTSAPGDVRERWAAAGAEVEILDASEAGTVSVGGLLERLGKRDVQGVLLEGGPTLAWRAVEEGAVDEIVVYVAPKLIGGVDAPGALGGLGVDGIAAARGVEIHGFERIGDDLKVVADVHRDR
jgi:diaminohydroxyphosphoribosylaminopyrimidine deaminase/5-amino-6-(5-phosphoribosylamino)uracil reductase